MTPPDACASVATGPSSLVVAANRMRSYVRSMSRSQDAVQGAGSLAGQVAVVTGGARGIGRAIAGRLESAGAVVEILDLAALDPVDVADEDAVRAGVSRVLESHGRIDVLVNNAGIYPHTPFDELTFAEWRRVLATNLDSVFLVTHAIYPAMRRAGYGRIVSISSAGLLVGEYGLVHYTASKGGIIGFTRSLAKGRATSGSPSTRSLRASSRPRA